MLGLGISLARGAFASIVTYVKDGLKLFYNFTEHQDNPISHASTGSTSFDGVDNYVDCGSDSSLDNIFAGGGTVSAWIYATGWGESNAGRIASKCGSGNVSGWNFNITNSGILQFLSDWSAPNLNAYAGTITLNTWHHVAVTYNSTASAGTDPVLYIDGDAKSLTITDSVGSVVTDAGSNLRIGIRGSGLDRQFDGSICNVGIWSRAISASEVQGIMYKKYADLSSAEQVSLVSFYGLDADYNDAHGSNNGTNSGSTLNATVYGGNAPQIPRILDVAPDSVKNYGTLKSGTALSFDGVSDYVDCGDNNDITTEDFSIAIWVKTSTDTGYVLNKKNGAVAYQLQMTSGKAKLWIGDGTNYASVESTDTITDDEWHLITATVDRDSSTGNKIYIDGTDVSANRGDPTGVGSLTNSGSLLIGKRSDGFEYTGKISNVKVFNSALTESEIQEMYLNPEQILPTGVSSSNLKLYLPMNEGAGTQSFDGSGNQNHGTISGATWDTANTDIAQVGLVRQNKPMVFDGSDDKVTVTNNSNLDVEAISISLWVYFEDLISSQSIVDRANVWKINMGQNDNKLTMALATSGKGWDWATATTTTLDVNNWYHIVTTYSNADNSGTIRYYINGVADATTDTSFSGTILSGAYDMDIGSEGTGSYFDGNINEVAIWDVALDADAVTALYNSGTPLDATTDSGNYDNSDGLQGYWRNDGDTTWTDRSTNSNNGTVSGSPASIVLTEGLTSGRDSQGFYLTDTTENCLTLNGAEYVEVDNILTQIGSDTTGTVEMWVRPVDSTPSAHLKVFSIDDTDANTSFFLQLRTDGIFRAMVKNAGTNQWYIETDSAELSSGTWHHIVLSQDGTSAVLYIDGDVPSQTFPVTTDKTAWLNDLSGVDNVIIGASNVSSGGYANFFDGDIDDFRYYSNKALSSDEVTKNYNAGKSKH